MGLQAYLAEFSFPAALIALTILLFLGWWSDRETSHRP